MVAPRYQGVLAAEIPLVEREGARVRVVAGELEGVEGPVTEIAARPVYFDVTLDPGAQLRLPVPEGHTVVLYLFEGEAVLPLAGTDQRGLVPAVHMLAFTDGNLLQVEATRESHARFMVMAGAPFQEPIFPYGPFVMNTREEIIQAFEDLQRGTFVQP